MKKKLFLFTLTLLLPFILAGCGDKYSADQYLGEQITSIKESDAEKLNFLLEDGIEESNSLYILQFPDELKEPYLSFLQEAFKTIDFKIASAKKNGENAFTVQVSYTPLDLASTLRAADEEYLSSLASSDLTGEVTALLENAKTVLKEAPQFKEKTFATVAVDKKGEDFQIKEDELNTFLFHTMTGYMDPYNDICELLDAQDFLTAYLDASFKGEVTQFVKHTDMTEEEALAWYEKDVFTPPDDMTPAYTERYVTALKALLRQCVYTVGIPKKESGVYNYTVDVTVTPNTSLENVFSEWNGGTYYSEDEVDRTLVELMEQYAASPVYGEETTVNIELNSLSIMEAGNDGASLTRLAGIILVMPE